MSNIRKIKKMMATLRSLLERQSHEGVVEMPLRFYGAHTGRWSGQGGINFQALAKKELFGVYIGKFLRARDGHTLVKLDLSNIEARVLLWLAGDTDTLDLIRGGMDIYEAHARSCNLYSGKKKLTEADPDLRQLCKARVLGLGFGCGAKTFQAVAAAMTGGKLQLSEDEAADAVYQYRQQNPKVTRLWNDVELFMSSGTAMRTIDLRLPSGRSLKYEITTTNPLKGSYIKGKPPVSLWGGTLTENMTQGVARDILALALLRLDKLGYRTILHIHDSVIIEVPEDEALVKTNDMIEALTTPPDWADGLPLDADIELGVHL
jgi:DNA polymerase